jgi:predicted nucleic-acid-binding Zn-ribbon protein
MPTHRAGITIRRPCRRHTPSLLTNWNDKNRNINMGPTNNGVSFTNVDGDEGDEIVMNTNGKEKKGKKVKDQNAFPRITCHKCGQNGLYATDCAEDHDIRQTGTHMLMLGVPGSEFNDQEDLKFSFDSDAAK